MHKIDGLFFEYDHRGRMTKRTVPLGMSETMTYDEDGNLLANTDFNGDTITFPEPEGVFDC